jgi:hypothetical protein
MKQVAHGLVVAYDSMYVDDICGMNLYFIHLYYSTRIAHGDMCSFVKVSYMVTHGI